jgi:hypothetical protein
MLCAVDELRRYFAQSDVDLSSSSSQFNLPLSDMIARTHDVTPTMSTPDVRTTENHVTVILPPIRPLVMPSAGRMKTSDRRGEDYRVKGHFSRDPSNGFSCHGYATNHYAAKQTSIIYYDTIYFSSLLAMVYCNLYESYMLQRPHDDAPAGIALLFSIFL